MCPGKGIQNTLEDLQLSSASTMALVMFTLRWSLARTMTVNQMPLFGAGMSPRCL